MEVLISCGIAAETRSRGTAARARGLRRGRAANRRSPPAELPLLAEAAPPRRP
eukprot:gene10282-4316_t